MATLFFATLVAAFSLRPIPQSLQGGLPVDVVDLTNDARIQPALAKEFPLRRPGSLGDQELAGKVASEFKESIPSASVSVSEFDGRTIDGRKRLVEVKAQILGNEGPPIAVVAHRDSIYYGGKAEMSATAGLIKIGQAVARDQFNSTILLYSTSGASGGGLAGARQLTESLPNNTKAVIVLGNLSATPDLRPKVVPWANNGTSAPPRLERTVVRALGEEFRGPATPYRGASGFWEQIARRSLPATSTEQGPFNEAGFSSVLVGAEGEKMPGAEQAVSSEQQGRYIRTVLRSMHAIDQPKADLEVDRDAYFVAGRLLPRWALQTLILVFLLPTILLILSASWTIYQRQRDLLPGVAQVTAWVMAPAIVSVVAVVLGKLGLIKPLLGSPLAGPAVIPGTKGWIIVAFLLLLFVFSVVLTTRQFLRDLGQYERSFPGLGAVVLVILLLIEIVLVVKNPAAAVLLLPAVVLWPGAISSVMLPYPLPKLLLAVAGWVLPIAAAFTVANSMGVGVLKFPWWMSLLYSGGQLGAIDLAISCAFIGCGLAATTSAIEQSFRGAPRRDRVKHVTGRRSQFEL